MERQFEAMPTSNYSRRLRKLEMHFTDATGLVPHSDAWFDYWESKLGQIGTGQEPDLRGITLDVIDSIRERGRIQDERDQAAAARA
jgi:hypothetical protein